MTGDKWPSMMKVARMEEVSLNETRFPAHPGHGEVLVVFSGPTVGVLIVHPRKEPMKLGLYTQPA